jgi:hypothetical protein
MIQKLRTKTNFSHKLFILLVFSLVILTVGVQSLEAGACETAFLNCMNELFAETTPFWLVYCANGYAFCLRYID